MPFVRCAPATVPVVHPFLKRSQADFGFNPLLEILTAVEKEATQQQTKRRKTVINPNFDIRETEHAFLLEGELPGVSNKDAIEIQFSDAQTLVIKGEIKRKVLSTERPETSEESTANATSETESVRSLKPTVEETVDDSMSDNAEAAADTPSTVTLNHEAQAEKSKEVAKPVETTKKSKFWLSERSVGVFERKFEFQELIDQEGVTASLEYGVLEVVVPKKQPYVRKVQIL